MKKLFSSGTVIILLINLNAVVIQDFYQQYFCDYDQEMIEMAGKRITVCGRTCDFEKKDSPLEMNQQTQPVQPIISPYHLPFTKHYIPLIKSKEITSPRTTYINHYSFITATDLLKPPCQA